MWRIAADGTFDQQPLSDDAESESALAEIREWNQRSFRMWYQFWTVRAVKRWRRPCAETAIKSCRAAPREAAPDRFPRGRRAHDPARPHRSADRLARSLPW